MINVEIEKNSSENSVSTLRRFTKRVQGAGILKRVRKIRYYSRPPSVFLKKKKALKRMKKKEEYEELIKLGKIQGHTRR